MLVHLLVYLPGREGPSDDSCGDLIVQGSIPNDAISETIACHLIAILRHIWVKQCDCVLPYLETTGRVGPTLLWSLPSSGFLQAEFLFGWRRRPSFRTAPRAPMPIRASGRVAITVSNSRRPPWTNGGQFYRASLGSRCTGSGASVEALAAGWSQSRRGRP